MSAWPSGISGTVGALQGRTEAWEVIGAIVGGVEHVLHIPATLLPIRISKLVPEIESYRPATELSSLDGPSETDQGPRRT